MPAGEYDILAEQGATYTLGLTYKDSTNTVIDLASYTARMQVRRSVNDDQMLLFLTGATASGSLTGGGSTGEFSASGSFTGISGVGSVRVNTSSTGATGYTGGVYVSIDATSMANIPAGKHRYDIELVAGSTVTKLLKGVFEVTPEVTK